MVVLKKNCTVGSFNKKEILRYAMCNGSDENTDKLLDECIKECEDVFTYNVCYTQLPVTFEADAVDLTFTKTTSTSLKTNLNGCDKIILFAATVGIKIDRLILKYSRMSPAKAVLFQAIGAERIEALCDAFEKEIKKDLFFKPRFSPGYGDFSIEIQKDIFRFLDCSRKIGLTLNDSFLMSPSKSVTAIIGVRRNV